MKNFYKVLRCSIILILTIFVVVSLGGCNSPRQVEVVNDIGEPLSINQSWNEPGIFEVKINSIVDVPLHNLNISDMFDDANQGEIILQELIDEGFVGILDVIFEFQNIGYDGFTEDNGNRVDGLFFMAMCFGYDQDGEFTVESNVKDLNIEQNYNMFRFSNPVLRGETASGNRMVLAYTEDTKKIHLAFRTIKDNWDYEYRKNFEYELAI